MRIVSSSGTDPDGERFDLLNGELRKMNSDIIDEHYYRRPEWFLANAARYDHYDRGGPKIFAGEYAAQSDKTVSVNNRNNWETAIAEAAFMTGLERNAGVISMASYAPLFAHADGWQWTPDLIWVDNLRAVGTANYQVQKLYSTNKGTHALKAVTANGALAGEQGLYLSAAIDKKTNELIIKLVNTSGAAANMMFNVNGVQQLNTSALVTVLHAESGDIMNTLDQPKEIIPEQHTIAVKGKKVQISAKASSFTVIRVAIKWPCKTTGRYGSGLYLQ
jgi:alpha-L-arabinofuranosidase